MSPVGIEFDRPDRVYRTGDEVTGTVVVDLGSDSACEAVVLRATWKTHGRGSVDKGLYERITLHDGPLPGAGVHRIPFRFEAPRGPFTYRGHHLNVDHYVEARVQIPWAFDPEAEEDFIVVPGSEVGPVPTTVEEGADPDETRKKHRVSLVIGGILAAVGIFTFPFPGVFFLFFAVVFAWAGLRKRLAGGLLGDVSAQVEPRVAGPGETVRVRVAVKPSKAVDVNEISATLRAREICVSGSGTDKTTHRHTAHSRKTVLMGRGSLASGERRIVDGEFTVPAVGMWSFAATRNRIVWDVEVRVDIPSWPDWVESVPFVVWPGGEGAGADAELAEGPPARAGLPPGPSEPEEAAPVAPGVGPWEAGRVGASREVEESGAEAGPAGDTAEVAAGVRGEVAAESREPPETRIEAVEADGTRIEAVEVEEEVSRAPDPAAAPAPAGAPGSFAGPEADGGSPVPDLAAAVREILEVDLFTGGRKEKVEALVGRRVDFVLAVERVERTLGRSRHPGYQDGRILRGTVAGSKAEVEVRVPDADGDAVAGLRRGDEHKVRGVVASWERLLERPVIRADPSGE